MAESSDSASSEEDDERDRPDPSIAKHVQSTLTKGSYESYGNPFIKHAIDRGWTGEKYKDAINNDNPLPTAEYLAAEGIFPICSSDNVKNYLECAFGANGRRRGKGIVTYSMALQVMKAITDLRTRELSRKIPQRQSDTWKLSNLEFTQAGKGVLRTPAVERILIAIQRREDDWKLVNCVDIKRSQHRLIGSQQLSLAVWGWKHGTPDHFRILSEFNIGRCCGQRQGNIAAFRCRHLKKCSLGSHASNLPEYPALGIKPSEIKENKEGRTDLIGAMIHRNPYLCPLASLGGWFVGSFNEALWGRMFPDLSKRDLWWNMYVFCTYSTRNSRRPMCSTTMSHDIKRAIMEGVGYSEEDYKKHFSGRSTHIWRHICAVETSFGGAPAQEGNRAGLWADKTVSRRELDYLNEDLPFLVTRASAGTCGPDPRTPHVTAHVPGSSYPPPSMVSG